jgi:hypothetical protein
MISTTNEDTFSKHASCESRVEEQDKNWNIEK